MRSLVGKILPLLVALILSGCSASKHVPEGQYLLDKVKLDINDSTKAIKTLDMLAYLRQQPNHKFLWSMKLQLGIYNISGKDTTRLWNKWWRKLGEAPVIYDRKLTDQSAEQLRKALVNKGFLSATVNIDTSFNQKKKKAKVGYTINAGEPHVIKSISYEFPNDTLRSLVMQDSSGFVVKPGDLLDRTLLDTQREMIMTHLRNRGYHGFSKQFISFSADTTAGSNDVDLTMTLNPPLPSASGGTDIVTHEPYRVGQIRIILDYDPVTMDKLSEIRLPEQVEYKGIDILYEGKPYLRPSAIYECCFIREGKLLTERDITNTYEALSRFSILKFANIRFVPTANIGNEEWVDVYILLTPDKSQTVTLELEGTNSEGDLGMAAGVTYNHRNIGKGSESFTAKFRGAYESISGNLDGLLHNRYMEYSADLGLEFPKFKFPLLTDAFKRSVRASTNLNVAFNYQERPEYTRLIFNGSWGYRWTERHRNARHKFTLLDINYVYLPASTNDFINQIAPDNPLLRYSYEDHFIMNMGYGYYHTNKRNPTAWNRGMQHNIYTIRANAEVAGNLLLLLSTIVNHRDNYREDPYKIFGIRYLQYFKVDGEYSFLHRFDYRNSIAFRAGLGVGFPYGNSTILPFEKRFYGGGANGVRGWAVRTLGPGRFQSTNNVSDFIRQCGDIRIIMSAEYRAKLFWFVELGLFVDAGNIWTIKDYATQPNGLFRFDSFYKELAASYGVGIRLDFDYFLIRFDLGMKAHNPALGEEPWPLLHPRWGRDHSFHFSIGYPF